MMPSPVRRPPVRQRAAEAEIDNLKRGSKMVSIRRAGHTVAIAITALKITPGVCRWNGVAREQAG
jgi:hypothetical protein